MPISHIYLPYYTKEGRENDNFTSLWRRLITTGNKGNLRGKDGEPIILQYFTFVHISFFPFLTSLPFGRSVGRSLDASAKESAAHLPLSFFFWRVYCCNLHLHWTSKRLFSIHTFVLSIVAIVYMCVCECVFFSAGNIECRQTGRYSSIVCSCLMLCCLSTKEKLGNPKNSIKFIIKSEYVNGFLCPFSQFWERSFPLASMLTHTHTNAWLYFLFARF